MDSGGPDWGVGKQGTRNQRPGTRLFHPWKVTPQEAIRIQEELRKRLRLRPPKGVFGRDPAGHGLQGAAGINDAFSLGGWSFKTEAGMDRGTVRKLYREITEELYQLLRVDEKYSGWEEYSLLTIYHCEHGGAGVSA